MPRAHRLELIAILEDDPAVVYRALQASRYTEETSIGLSTVPLAALPAAEQKRVRADCRAGMRARGLTERIVPDARLTAALLYTSDEVERPLFHLDPEQGLLVFRYETVDGLGIEFIEYLLEQIERDADLQFQPAELLDIEPELDTAVAIDELGLSGGDSRVSAAGFAGAGALDAGVLGADVDGDHLDAELDAELDDDRDDELDDELDDDDEFDDDI